MRIRKADADIARWIRVCVEDARFTRALDRMEMSRRVAGGLATRDIRNTFTSHHRIVDHGLAIVMS